MIYIYRVFYSILKWTVLLFKPLMGSKFNAWVHLRNQSTKLSEPLKKSFWFHASSGEIEYVKSLILDLRAREPLSKIVVTYSSPSAEKLFSNIRSAVDVFLPIPWDQPHVLQAFIEKIDPIILIFSRTDFWPELIFQVKNKKIPIAIVSYYGRITFVKRILYPWLFKNIQLISCVDETQSVELQSLLPTVRLIQADGDTRFDQVFWRLAQPTKVELHATRPILICGSTWREDEAQLWPAFDRLLKKNYQIILSPHEVSEDNIKRITQLLQENKYSFQILSAHLNKPVDFKSDFLIVDRIGYLADLYRFAQIAFVGGSFKEKVHSVMEPLCCGLPVIVGPNYTNNPEANKYKNETNPRVIYKVENSQDFLKAVEAIELEKTAFKEKIIQLMLKNKNSTKKIMNALLSNVLKISNS